MASYAPAFVISNGTLIGLPFIESIDLGARGDEDAVIDRLKGDLRFNIKTASGKEYTLSMLQHIGSLTEYSIPTDVKELGQAIVDKWSTVMENKCGNSTK
jgi:hypothetical protein